MSSSLRSACSPARRRAEKTRSTGAALCQGAPGIEAWLRSVTGSAEQAKYLMRSRAFLSNLHAAIGAFLSEPHRQRRHESTEASQKSLAMCVIQNWRGVDLSRSDS